MNVNKKFIKGKKKARIKATNNGKSQYGLYRTKQHHIIEDFKCALIQVKEHLEGKRKLRTLEDLILDL